MRAVTSPIAPQRSDVRLAGAGRSWSVPPDPGAAAAGRHVAGGPVGASGMAGAGTGDGDRGGPVDGSDLRLVARRPSPATFWRRRVAAAAGLVVAVLVLLGGFGQFDVAAGLADRVDGHVIVEPGQTLWDVAAQTAPDGVDVRAHLAAIEDLNGIRADDLRAWNVVLLPAR